jgi:hypothetical protein
VRRSSAPCRQAPMRLPRQCGGACPAASWTATAGKKLGYRNCGGRLCGEVSGANNDFCGSSVVRDPSLILRVEIHTDIGLYTQLRRRIPGAHSFKCVHAATNKDHSLWVLGTPLTARVRRLIPQGIVRLAESFCRVSPAFQTLGHMPRSANLVGLLDPRRARTLRRFINDISADLHRQKHRQRDLGGL